MASCVRSRTVRPVLSPTRFELGSIDRMSAIIEQDTTSAPRLIGEAPPSPSGPAPDDGAPLKLPPALQALRFSVRQVPLLFKTRRELGETFAIRFPMRRDYADDRTYVVSHPDHVRSIFT